MRQAKKAQIPTMAMVPKVYQFLFRKADFSFKISSSATSAGSAQ